MISIRTIVVSLLSLAFAAFALPALAQKTFSIQSGFEVEAFANFSPGEVRGTDLPTPAAPIGRIVLQNNSPTGNSNFNSFRIFAPADCTIASAAKPSDETRAGSVGKPAIWAGSATDARNGLCYVNVTSISPSVDQCDVCRQPEGSSGVRGRHESPGSSRSRAAISAAILRLRRRAGRRRRSAERRVAPCGSSMAASREAPRWYPVPRSSR